MINGRIENLGVVEWFHPGEYGRVEKTLERMRYIGCDRIRTHISWAEYHNDGGQDWYDWLLPTLSREAEVLPCIHYTPPSISESGRSNGPPRNLYAYADFVDHAIERHGGCFSTVELWNEPNNLLDWDWRLDVDWQKFCTMVGAAGYWVRRRGRKAVLGGPCPNDLNWLNLIGERGVLSVVDAVGLHGFPGTWDSEQATWQGWDELISSVRDVIDRHSDGVEIWITETGYSSWRLDWANQIARFVDAADAPAERFYWYGLQDLADEVAVQEGHRFDERHYHLGLFDKKGRAKPLARLLMVGGLDAVRAAAQSRLATPSLKRINPVLVTGGAGFVGCSLADRLARDGEHVVIIDSLARAGVEQNAAWLVERHGSRVSSVLADLRDQDAIADATADASAVFHLAAQVAVTSSMEDPTNDFDVNLRGTHLLLEAVRRRHNPPPVIFASTNKVYGDLADIRLVEGQDRYWPANPELAKHGISESRMLSFCTPYGCSKGAADQYVCDYARSFGIPAVVLRMSCIYGPRQFGTEDQGWVAHLLMRALKDETITIFGNGKQVRDILFIDDAVETYVQAWKNIHACGHLAFNLGGGPSNAISLIQLCAYMRARVNPDIHIEFKDWRAGDQRYYVSDAGLVQRTLGLAEPLHWLKGIQRLTDWLRTHHNRGVVAPPSVSELRSAQQ